MKFHPDVLAAHAQFGGDLEDMQRQYDTPTQPTATTTEVSEADERAAFEAWAATEWINSNPPQSAWFGWRARAALSAGDGVPGMVQSQRLEQLIGTGFATSSETHDMAVELILHRRAALSQRGTE